jgi:hypothetical protein
MTGPRGTFTFSHKNATCQSLIRPPICQVNMTLIPDISPSFHVLYDCTDFVTSARARCHPCSGATCHNLTRPPVNTYHISTCPRQHANSSYGHVAYTVSCHINTVWIVRTAQSSNFPCLEKQTYRDIFCIRCLFDLIQVVLGSY